MSDTLVTVALGPLLLVQGLLVRRRALRLPEAPGPREGVSGQGRPFKLLIVGDSAAAGVGAAHQREALLGRVVDRLAATCQVDWRLLAKTGATTASTLKRLRRLDPVDFDAVVTSLGVNDVTSGLPRSRWREQQAALRLLLRNRFGASFIVVSGQPPVDGFPALPQPLRWYLGRRARQFDDDLRRDVAAESGCSFLAIDFTRDTRLMAADGFHPGPGIYDLWGQRVADLVLGRSAGGNESGRHFG